MRSNRRRCYCDRLYPGFKCAYCRVAEFIADEEEPDPRELAKAAAETTARPGWLARATAYGKALFRRTP